jgi:hypothetical protein
LRLLGYFIQIDRGVTPDLFFQFDISTLAKIWPDTPKIFATEILPVCVFQAILDAP